MIELRGLAAGYHRRPVVQDIDLAFRPGEVLVLDARSFRRGFLSVDVSAPLT